MKHFIVLCVVLGAASMAHTTLLRAQAEAGRVTMPESIREIPENIADFQQMGTDEGVDERTKQVLETSSILIRNYRASNGWPVQLTIVYAGATRRSLHFPELCLVGSGWEIRRQEAALVGMMFEARRLVLVKGEDSEAVLYWFKTGDEMTGNYFLNAYYWAQNQMMFGAPTSAMIRLAVPIGPGGEEAAFAVLDDFAFKLVPYLQEHVP